jgi:hypothetical protein
MRAVTPPPGSADEGLDKVDRGQRIRREVQIQTGHDGKERANFALPRVRDLEPDTDSESETTPVTVESVVEVPETASAWEALEEE